MDNPTRWNITNSAQNIVSALVDPSKQFDYAFKRDWSNTFSGFTRYKQLSTTRQNQDTELKVRLKDYLSKLDARKHIKLYDEQQKAVVSREGKEQQQRQDDTPQDNVESKTRIIVPEVFLMENFDLSNHEIFNLVISSTLEANHKSKTPNYLRANGIKQQSSRLILEKEQLKALQQCLTDYSDIIEEKLAGQISNRSGDFFQVMSSVDSVMDELSLAIKSVTSLRGNCSNLKDALISPDIKNLRKKRNNTVTVLNKMKEIAQLCRVQSMIQLSLSASDFAGARDLIAKSRVQLRRDFNNVICLRNLESELLEYERMIVTMMQQAEMFVNQFHEERKKRIELSLDNEQWKIVEDIHPDCQRLITLLVDKNSTVGEAFSFCLNFTTEDGKPKHGSGTGKEHVMANEGTYVIVDSVINLIQVIMEYCKCAVDIKSLSDEILERLFIILQLFNSKVYHLVYSAGAIQVAGLKTITTRSLVISQRSLHLVILLIPAIHRHFSQLLPDYNRLKRFDEIKSSYEDHAAKIPERVNSIVRDVIDLQLQEWAAKPPVPSPQFTSVVKHLMRLHDNIQDALPPKELRLLFLKISQTFKEVLLVHLRRLNITNDAGPQQWLVTQELTFCKISLSKLSVFKDMDLNYEDLWTSLSDDNAAAAREEVDIDPKQNRSDKELQEEEVQK